MTSKIITGTFLDHLDELRRRLWTCVLFFAVSAVGSFFYSDQLLEIVLWPAKHEVSELYFFKPADVFVVKMKIAMLAGFFVSSPVIVGQLWLFVSPAMHRHEKRALLPLITVSSLLFIGGALFSFFQVLPATLHFLLSLQGSSLKPMLSVSEYLSFFGMMLVSFGFAFNLPVVILGLAATGVLNVKVLNQFQRQAIVLIFIAAAVLTPGPDVASQLMLALPLLALFEISVGLAALMEMTQKKKNKVLA